MANRIRGKDIKNFSDSQASLKSLQKDLSTSRLVEETVELINRIITRYENRVTLIWIPAHKGHYGNEEVDSLAKEGSNTAFVGPQPVLLHSKSTAIESINCWGMK